MRADVALFAVVAVCVACGAGFLLLSDPVPGGPAGGRRAPRGRPRVGLGAVGCAVVVVGAGVGGLFVGHRLAPLLGRRLCVVDDRDEVGGKVRSLAVPGRPGLWAPTCAEQLRDVDVQLRCLCRDFNITVFARGEVSTGAGGSRCRLTAFGIPG